MYKTENRDSTRLERLMCQWFGHQMMEGLKYHSATKHGCSMVCQRCGVYEVLDTRLMIPRLPLVMMSVLLPLSSR